MKANLTTNKIEMTRNEAKAAGKVGTPEFLELKQLKDFFPTYAIEITAPARRKNDYKGLTYDYMRSYIEKHGKEETTKDFEALINDNTSYLEVKEWFLKTFPEIEAQRKEHEKTIKEILNKPAKKQTNKEATEETKVA